MKLRTVMSDVCTMKKGTQGRTRAFGGINLLCCGDLWQLDPPSGGFLGAIPVEFMRKAMKFDAKPDIAHGQAIFWHEGEGCIQGVTELTECVRTEDPWLLEVQQQMRSGQLSRDSWCFLHGKATTVPGSWVNGAPSCGNDRCLQNWQSVQKECEVCALERQSKHRVMNDPKDERHKRSPFYCSTGDLCEQRHQVRS